MITCPCKKSQEGTSLGMMFINRKNIDQIMIMKIVAVLITIFISKDWAVFRLKVNFTKIGQVVSPTALCALQVFWWQSPSMKNWICSLTQRQVFFLLSFHFFGYKHVYITMWSLLCSQCSQNISEYDTHFSLLSGYVRTIKPNSRYSSGNAYEMRGSN